jgi:hypothetical protein
MDFEQFRDDDRGAARTKCHIRPRLRADLKAEDRLQRTTIARPRGDVFAIARA